MRRLDERDASERTAADADANGVLEQQRRLTAEFELTRHQVHRVPDVMGRFERLLCAILASADWRGPRHRIFEALPHLEPIGSFRMLRTVLARLDVRLIPSERRASDLSADELPCLVVGGEDDCRLLVRGPSGGVEACDLTNAAKSEVNLASVPGAVYLIRLDKADDASRAHAFGGFVGEALRRLRGPLIRIAVYSAAINALGLALSLYLLLVYDLIIATGSLDTLAYLALGAFVCLVFDLRLRHRRSSSIAYLAARFDGAVAARAFASVLSLPLSLTERAPLSAQLSRFRQFEVGRDLFAGNLASAIFDLPFTLLFIVLLFVLGGSLAFVPIGLSLVMIIVCVLAATVSTGHLKRLERQQAEVRRLALRADGQAQDHQERLGRTHVSGTLCRQRRDLPALAFRDRADRLAPAHHHQRSGRAGRHRHPQHRRPARHGWRHVAGRPDRCHDDRLARARADPDCFAQYCARQADARHRRPDQRCGPHRHRPRARCAAQPVPPCRRQYPGGRPVSLVQLHRRSRNCAGSTSRSRLARSSPSPDRAEAANPPC